MIEEHDIVRVLVAKGKVPARKVGTVVYIYGDGKVFAVEFIYEDPMKGSEIEDYAAHEVEKI